MGRIKKPKKTAWQRALDGMGRVATNEDPEWADFVLDRAMTHALRHEFFDVSEINVLCPDLQPKNPKSWGHFTNCWVKQGWCKKTGVIVTSKKPRGNCHKLCQLQSLIFEKL